ncbi:D-alanyl-D-alanine carboxypeptidase/D-alanyl-D-alanine endopeptidase [Nocardioides panaciterrulae]|uniref:D-alanyl-D-alanine carboxypeptidase/D-alanyl-D-alanine-endopeptidase (Penicillin-binding protein 4) n=1 Tax=Nocardioides panaciterrulae TaxID=661492 RepID=A0A7Y9E988_9ACTN|nr:D-alanyl-D-alanine carboxypeptidase/D-alanyl-D-alanine-endopeptidase (penicillin-binding protein 4) [Nocardioides panaciterrulae]
MARRDPRHVGRTGRGGDRWLHLLPVLLVLGVLAATAVVWQLDGEAGAPAGPLSVPPPAGVTLPPAAVPSPVADPVAATALDARSVRRALAHDLDDRELGSHVRALVTPLDGGDPAFVSGHGVATPASTMKLLTTTAALATMGPDHTFTTRVVDQGAGRIVLVGGGDPYLASRPAGGTAYPPRADVVTLARRTADALAQAGEKRVRLGYDNTLFSGPAVDPHWPADYIPDGVVAPISALWVDEGRPASGFGRVADPARAAADAFAAALVRAGIHVTGRPRPQRAAADAPTLATVESAPLSEIVEEILTVSDNEGAEVLGHHVGLATGGEGSFRDGARGVERTLSGLGVPLTGARIHDGSGLSRQDRLDPATLAAVLVLAADPAHPDLRAVVTGLPVAGFTGSLTSRFDQADPVADGHVRAKTGTLSGVSALAGITTDLDGDPMVFVLMADRIRLQDTLGARAALDDLAAGLADCHCGG